MVYTKGPVGCLTGLSGCTNNVCLTCMQVIVYISIMKTFKEEKGYRDNKHKSEGTW